MNQGRIYFILVLLFAVAPACQQPEPRSCGIDSAATGEDQEQDLRQEMVKHLLQKALHAYREEDQPQARKLLKELLQVDAANGLAHNTLGLVYLAEENLYNAALEFQAASRLMMSSYQPCYNLGLTFERGGQYDLAIREYNRALDRRPDELKTMENLVRVMVLKGDRGPQLGELLAKCLAEETRSQWRYWLEMQQLVLDGTRETSSPKSAGH